MARRAAARRDEPSRVLSVVHETLYRYEEPVERSTHVFRFRPVQDHRQELLEHKLEITPSGESACYEDVFGNQTTRMKLRRSYTKLSLVATSLVRVAPEPPLRPPERRISIPLVWMPWQREMMQSYLLPAELPETQLRELTEFAMSFVERQDYDLLETLSDINHTIRQDFVYAARSTTLETTPFDVYTNRTGVCQDFANLFICLARLLGIPARYRVGYLYTGGDYENRLQSEASHAWVEAYLPRVGWRGYDPTNGCLAGLDHVRVAVGRNYRDATPTSGTIYKGGSGEVLSVSVQVEQRRTPTDPRAATRRAG
ncbi:MAG: transglutaminase family protein [Polyangiaceae bacterium]|nr:transglutaminase family protein [Polyangiaceae bacterium]